MLWSTCPVWLFAVLCECKGLQLLSWELWCLVVLWHPCAGQCMDDTWGLGMPVRIPRFSLHVMWQQVVYLAGGAVQGPAIRVAQALRPWHAGDICTCVSTPPGLHN